MKAFEEVEQLGIVRSREALADAAIVLVVLDATQPMNHEERSLLAPMHDRSALVAINKSDLANNGRDVLHRGSSRQPMSCDIPAVATSALTGEGIAALREQDCSASHGRSGG